MPDGGPPIILDAPVDDLAGLDAMATRDVAAPQTDASAPPDAPCADNDEDGHCAGNDCDDSTATGASCFETCSMFFEDSDGDGWGNAARPIVACVMPAGFAARAGDCADQPTNDPLCGNGNGNRCHPGLIGMDLCDGLNNDCNTETADGSDESTFGDPCDGPDSDRCIEGTLSACDGFDLVCSDKTANSPESPGSVGTCNDGFDNDCDGFADGADPGCALPGTVQVDGAGDGAARTGDGGPSASWTHTTGQGSNRLLVVGCNIRRDNNQSITGVTYGGTSLNLIHAETNPSGRRTELWTLLAPAPGANTITVQVSPNALLGCGSVTLVGVDQSNPYDPPVGRHGTGVPPPVDLNVPSSTGDLVLDYIGYGGGITGTGSAQSPVWAQAYRSIQNGASTAPGAASVTMSWSLQSTGNSWCIQAISVNPAP